MQFISNTHRYIERDLKHGMAVYCLFHFYWLYYCYLSVSLLVVVILRGQVAFERESLYLNEIYLVK